MIRTVQWSVLNREKYKRDEKISIILVLLAIGIIGYSPDKTTEEFCEDHLQSIYHEYNVKFTMASPSEKERILNEIESKFILTKIEIYNLLGQEVKQVYSNFETINLEDLSRGLYLIKISSENGSTVRKLIKN